MYNKMNAKEKVLGQLCEDSYREYHIRLLAKLTKLSPNTIITVTDELQKEKIVTKERDEQTHKVSVKADTQNRLFLLHKKFYNLRKIYDSGLVDHLQKELSFPTIVLFGSYAKAENRLGSDVDLCIISDVKKKVDVSGFEKDLGSEIQFFLHSQKEFKELTKRNKELINNVLNGYVLAGYLEAL